MKKATCSFSWESHISPSDSNFLQENFQGMDGQQAKKKGRAAGSDDGLESSSMDICHSSSDDIYGTANSDTLIENLLKLQPDLQNFKKREERRMIGSANKKDDEIPQSVTISELGRRMKSQEPSASFQTMGDPDLEEETDSELTQNESSESTDAFQKKTIKIEAELQDEITKGQKFQRAIEDLRKKLVSLEEESKALKTELQRPLGNDDGVKRLTSDIENNGWDGASTLEAHKMACITSEQQELNSVVSRQNKKNIEKEYINVQELSLEEDKSSLRAEATCEQQGMKSFRDGTSNLLMEIEDLINEKSGWSDSMQEKITILQQELQAKTELVEIQQKQIMDLLQSLAKSNCENARLTSEQNRSMAEQGDVNTLQAELVGAQQENQKLQKELSTKFTELKNLHILFSTLGREKEIMAAELVLKARILSEMQEELNDLKEQNMILSNKLEAYARENKTKDRDTQVTIASLHNRNKLLAEQVLKTSEGYRALQRKSKELQKQNSEFKREIGNLKASILKQEKFTHVLEAERASLVNEITWGKQQLHFLLKKCECVQQETESLTEQQLMEQDREISLKDEIVFLEQLLLRFKEEIAGIKAESDRAIKGDGELKEEMAILQNELLNLRTENGLLTQEKKVDGNRDGSIKRLEDTAGVLFCKGESLPAEVAETNMEKIKHKLDDVGDRMIHIQNHAVPPLKMIPASETRDHMNQN